MKKNVKSANAIQSLLLQHAEKAVMLVAVLLAGWLIYGSLTPEGATQSPDELDSMVAQTSREVTEFTPSPDSDTEGGIKRAESFQLMNELTIDANDYQTASSGVWGRPVVPTIVMRDDPLLLPAVSLEGVGMTTLMATEDPDIARRREEDQLRQDAQRELERERERERQLREEDAGRGRGRGRADRAGPGMAPPAGRRGRGRGGMQLSGDERIDVVSFAAVTALVPVSDQVKLYLDTFENARGYDATRDLPQWLGYYIQRAEVTSGGDVQWQPVKIEDRSRATRGRQYNFVNSAVILNATADWISQGEGLADNRYIDENLTFPLPPIIGQSFGREVVHSTVPLQAETDALMEEEQNQDYREAVPDPEALLEGGERPRRGGQRMRGMEDMGRRGGARGMSSRGGRGGRGGGYERSMDHLMLRFFDFGVEPGKRYRYRVRLVMQDPNAESQVDSDYLKREVKQRVESARSESRLTEWSEPSKIISVPDAGEVMVAGVDPPPRNSPNGEPQVNLLVKSFDVDEANRAVQAEDILTFHRGSVINRTEEDVMINKGGRMEEVEEFTFRTNATLLDIYGGQDVNRETTTPGRVLIMDASGKLHVRDELSAFEEVQRVKAANEEPRRNSGRRDGRATERGGFELGL